jgi:hypothetical protein
VFLGPVRLNLLAQLISHGTMFFLSQQNSISWLISRKNHQPMQILGNRQIKFLSQQHEKGIPSKEANHCKLEHVCESNKIH